MIITLIIMDTFLSTGAQFKTYTVHIFTYQLKTWLPRLIYLNSPEPEKGPTKPSRSNPVSVLWCPPLCKGSILMVEWLWSYENGRGPSEPFVGVWAQTLPPTAPWPVLPAAGQFLQGSWAARSTWGRCPRPTAGGPQWCCRTGWSPCSRWADGGERDVHVGTQKQLAKCYGSHTHMLLRTLAVYITHGKMNRLAIAKSAFSFTCTHKDANIVQREREREMLFILTKNLANPAS